MANSVLNSGTLNYENFKTIKQKYVKFSKNMNVLLLIYHFHNNDAFTETCIVDEL